MNHIEILKMKLKLVNQQKWIEVYLIIFFNYLLNKVSIFIYILWLTSFFKDLVKIRLSMLIKMDQNYFNNEMNRILKEVFQNVKQITQNYLQQQKS